MLIKKLFAYLIISLIFCNFVKSQEIIIISKVDNEIITNIDIEIEKKYLLLLNNNLNELSKNEFFELAKNSLVREIIKKKEINKSFNQQSEITKNKIIEKFYKDGSLVPDKNLLFTIRFIPFAELKPAATSLN